MTSGLLDGVLRVDVFAEGELAARSRVMTTGRLPLNPLRLREARQELAHLRAKRRRGDGLREDPDARALAGFLRLEWTWRAVTNALNGRMSPRFVMFRDRSGS
jgi:hypothetical protein